MNVKRILLGIVGALLILVLPRGATGTAHAVAINCDRACLFGVVDQYLAAMVAHDPSRAPIAKGAKFTENGQELTLPDGLWRIATGLRDYKNLVADPSRGAVGGFTVVEENGKPVILGFRLKVVDRKITEMETIVIRKGPGSFGEPDNLKAPRPDFARIEPAKTRRSRTELIKIANTYFSALQKNDGSIHPPFADDCNRIENGVQTTNNPNFKSSSGTVGPATMSCAKAFALGYYREDSRLRDRRWLIVDSERGLVFAGVFFDHDAALRSYKLTNGETVHVQKTSPWTWEIMELFKIHDGKIGPVEAVVNGVPYGMRPGW
ncbi:MAG TPA: hypothetical protein VKA19_12220 [Alphaproteobacteria bacterium]|nr:hypothetical protein [Alphaproteobacteria bacterium]